MADKPERTVAEVAADREILRKRGVAVLDATNPDVRAEYHRRLQRGEPLLLAWRRALWTVATAAGKI